MDLTVNPNEGLIRQAISLLLTGANYGAYRDEQQARMDDILIRQQASQAIMITRDQISTLLAIWSADAIPGLNAEQPYPSPAKMAILRRSRACLDRLSDIQTRILTAPTRTAEVWSRLSTRTTLIEELIRNDIAFLQACEATKPMSAKLSIPISFGPAANTEARAFEAALQEVETSLHNRQALLASKGP